MTITVLYFADLREAMNCTSETLDLPAEIKTVGELRRFIAARGADRAPLGQMANLRCAINQNMADWNAAIADDDEVAFFPPVTGG